ncbi:MAG: sigma-70 family RNA polymerase sigma factor [Planctomycetota bacterium]
MSTLGEVTNSVMIMATNPPRTDLFSRLDDGDRDAFTELVDQYGGLIWSMVRNVLRSSADRDDAVQDILMSLWKNAGRFDPSIASEATFIAMITRRRLIDLQRRRGRRPDHDALPVEPALISTDRLPERLEQSEEVRVVMQAMGQLRPAQQRVLTLAIQHGHTYEQIAEVTGMPVGTVKTHARRGLMKVRDLLSTTSTDASSRQHEEIHDA